MVNKILFIILTVIKTLLLEQVLTVNQSINRSIIHLHCVLGGRRSKSFGLCKVRKVSQKRHLKVNDQPYTLPDKFVLRWLRKLDVVVAHRYP